MLARQTLDYGGKSTALVGYALKGNRTEGYFNFFFSLHDDNNKNAFKKPFLLVMVYNKGVQEGARFNSLLDLLANAWQPQRPFQRHCPVACSILLGDKMEATC